MPEIFITKFEKLTKQESMHLRMADASRMFGLPQGARSGV
jgi:hypothetical protein